MSAPSLVIRFLGRAFVKLPGFRRNALIKAQEISNVIQFRKEDTQEDRLAAVAGLVGPGDSVFVKVIEAQFDDAKNQWKIGASMRLVSQKDGRDLVRFLFP